MSQIGDITDLQSIDDQAATLTANREDVEQRLAGDDELAAARERLVAAADELAGLRREQRRLDGEVAALDAKVQGEEKRLYDGSIKNPKELGSLQHEVDTLKQRRGAFEDELLEVLAAIETAASAHDHAAALANNLEARWATEEARLQQEAVRLDALLAATESKRREQAARLPAASLSLYERIRARRGNTVVARIAGGACSGCRISLPDAVRRRAASPNTLVQCPNCGRILAAS